MKRYILGKSGKIYDTKAPQSVFDQYKYDEKYVWHLIDFFPQELWGIIDSVIADADTRKELENGKIC